LELAAAKRLIPGLFEKLFGGKEALESSKRDPLSDHPFDGPLNTGSDHVCSSSRAYILPKCQQNNMHQKKIVQLCRRRRQPRHFVVIIIVLKL